MKRRHYLVNFGEDVHELLLAGSEAHGSQDLVQVVRGEEVLLLAVEQVEAGLEALDLVDLEAGDLVDLVELDACVDVWFARHPLVCHGATGNLDIKII